MLDQQKQRDQESEVADAVDDEGFLSCGGGRVLYEEEADQQIRRQADALPADEHQQVVAGQDQRQHEKHEQVQVGEEAVEAAFLPHVADGINVNQETNAGDDQQHDQRKLVEIEGEVDLEIPSAQPGCEGFDVRQSEAGELGPPQTMPSQRPRRKKSARRRTRSAGRSVSRSRPLMAAPASGSSGISQR